MQIDTTGAGWGEGVIRFPNRVWWGWNQAMVKKSGLGFEGHMPVAIVYGSKDTAIFAKTPARSLEGLKPNDTWTKGEAAGPPFNPTWLYDAIPGPRKWMVTIDETGHFMPLELQYEVLHDYSLDWIRNKHFGVDPGSYHRNGRELERAPDLSSGP